MASLLGLIGDKLGHSFSPLLHQKLMEKLKLEGYYHLFEVEAKKLKDAIIGLKALNATGVSVTTPYKIEIMKYLDELSNEAVKIGAVNTIHFLDQKAIGYNTDYDGFGLLIKKLGVVIEDKKAVLLGTGGAAKGVYHYLLDHGIREIKLVSRNKELVKKEFEDTEIVNYEEFSKLKGFDILVNCTPLGMYPKIFVSPLKTENFLDFQYAIDLIYNPQETLFLKKAKEKGLTTINGWSMLLGQGAKAQEIWHGIKIGDDVLSELYLELTDFI